MRRRLTSLAALVGLLTAGSLAVATPSYATTISNIYCELISYDDDLEEYHYTLTATAVYQDNVGGAGLRRWDRFRYRLDGEPGRVKNNVNIRLSESGRDVFTWNSPDDRKSGIWYTLSTSASVFTSVWGPSGEHDHRANDLLEFQGIFDKPMQGDPRCTAWVKV